MKAALRWRRQVDFAPGESRDEQPPGPAGATGTDSDIGLQSSWTGGPALMTKAATGALWVGLLAGPAALLLTVGGASSSTAATVRPAAPVVDRVGEQVAAAEFAGRLVTLWLTSVRGQEAQLAPLLGGVQLSLPSVAWSVGPATVADERRLPDDTWMVVTAVAVRPAASPSGDEASSVDPTSAPPVGWPVRYFQVPVHLDAAGPVALALPAPVAAPGVAGQSPRLDYRYPVVGNDPIGVSVTQFLAALLTGTGDVTRYVSPGTTVSPVTPAPYTAVEVTDIATDRELTTGAPVPVDGARRRALITATVTAAPQQKSTVQYALTLTVRGGRWEITAIDPAPALQPTASPPPVAGSPRPAPAAPGTASSATAGPSGSTPTTPSS